MPGTELVTYKCYYCYYYYYYIIPETLMFNKGATFSIMHIQMLSTNLERKHKIYKYTLPHSFFMSYLNR